MESDKCLRRCWVFLTGHFCVQLVRPLRKQLSVDLKQSMTVEGQTLMPSGWGGTVSRERRSLGSCWSTSCAVQNEVSVAGPVQGTAVGRAAPAHSRCSKHHEQSCSSTASASKVVNNMLARLLEPPDEQVLAQDVVQLRLIRAAPARSRRGKRHRHPLQLVEISATLLGMHPARGPAGW